MKVRLLILLTFLFLFSCFLSQNNKIDSLKSLLHQPQNSEDINVLFPLCNAYTFNNYDSAIKYAEIGLQLAEKTGHQSQSAFQTCLGNVYFEKGEYDKSISRYLEAEKIYKTHNDKKGMIIIYGNIGLIYIEQNLYEKARLQFEIALEIATENNYKGLIASNLNSLGILSYYEKKPELALEKYKDALTIFKELNEKPKINECLNNIAIIYQETGKYNEALDYFNQYLNFSKQQHEERGLAAAYHNLALVYKDMKNLVKTIVYLDSSIAAANKVRAFQDLVEVYDTYTEIFTEQKNYEKAFEYFQLKASAKDSLIQQTRDQQFAEMSTKYQSEKKEAENKILKASGERQKAINIAITTGLFLVALLAFIIFRSYTQKKKANTLLEAQNIEIRKQKTIIEDQHKDIKDSIQYAKRIQDAILPPINHLTQKFPDSFVMYRPKDIVAGDFYWMEQKNDHIFIAACDCTGHGVPGAMVSVVCSTALSRVVKEFGIIEPGKILDRTRELVLETFEKSEKDVKDGMDISLVSMNIKNGDVKWAGAYNRLWYSKMGNIIEIAADKQPIGKTEEPLPFTTHSISLIKGDCFYLFTDGLADQFGGPQGKKLKYKLFKETLHKHVSLPMTSQKQQLENFFDTWKGQHEQVDDVCVLGFCI